MKLLTYDGPDYTSYYTLLGVKRTANERDIRKAYRKKSRKYHPDVYGSDTVFLKLRDAYNVLMDPKARLRYDISGLTDKELNQTIEKFLKLVNQMFHHNITDEKQIQGNIRKVLEQELQKHNTDKQGLFSNKQRLEKMLEKFDPKNFLMEMMIERTKAAVLDFDNKIAGIDKTITFLNAEMGLVNLFSIKRKPDEDLHEMMNSLVQTVSYSSATSATNSATFRFTL